MRSVLWRPGARADLFALYEWIAGQTDPSTAYEYTAAVEGRTADLAAFPHRGAPRPELGPGIRTLVHRRRTVIAYRVTDETVEVVALAHGGRDLAGAFDAEDR